MNETNHKMGDALRALYPKSDRPDGWWQYDVDYDSLVWQFPDSFPKPSRETVENKLAELNTAGHFANLRDERDKRLSETDWMANSDVTMSDAWRTYRQALRDLPANTSDPANPVWPTKPS